MKPTRPIQCPTCSKAGDWRAGPFAPFCSHRCKLIDLGKWLGGEHRIAEPLRSEEMPGEEGSEGAPDGKEE